MEGSKFFEWIRSNRAVAIAAIVCVTLIVVVILLRPPRYQKAAPNNNLILDTQSGKMLRMDGTPIHLSGARKNVLSAWPDTRRTDNGCAVPRVLIERRPCCHLIGR